MAPLNVTITCTERLLPAVPPREQAIPLSLLDATAAEFALTSAIWLFDAPATPLPGELNFEAHLHDSLQVTLDAFPQWCGHLKSITTIGGDGNKEAERFNFQAHARRFSRVYVHFGTASDPGIELVTAQSAAALEDILPANRTRDQPLWNRHDTPLAELMPQISIVSAISPEAVDQDGLAKPTMAIQITRLADGALAIAAKIAHPLADISSLVCFMKHWAAVSRATLHASDIQQQMRSSVHFDPAIVDAAAAGNINAKTGDGNIIDKTSRLPFHRNDWWAVTPGSPRSNKIPEIFRGQDLPPAGKPLPWSQWDVKSPVSHYTIHFTSEQVEWLHQQASNGGSSHLSRHDAILAHIWSCICRARNLQDDTGPVHCDLVLGLRPLFKLGSTFLGSPSVMINAELAGKTICNDDSALQSGARCIRETITKASNQELLAAHLHSIAYEKSPQRIWQSFLGQRHIMVTTWARMGLYEVDFGLGKLKFADGMLPDLDGLVLIKEGPFASEQAGSPGQKWTANGIDVCIHLRSQDMEELLKHPDLLPQVHGVPEVLWATRIQKPSRLL